MRGHRAPSISTHVLDQEQGCPARGCAVTLSRWEDGRLVRLSRQVTDDDGRVADLVAGDLRVGAYQLAFDVAGYLAEQGRAAPFLARVTVDFRVADAARHYHVPLLLTPYSCTSYRGS